MSAPTANPNPVPAPLVVGDGRTVHPISLGGPRTDGLLTRIAGDIGDAVNAVEKFWGTDWDRDIVLIATDSDAQFVAQAGLDPRLQWTDIAAVSVADRVDLPHHSATGQRIVFAPGAVKMSDASLRIVLTHELFHLAARADTAPDAPRWLVEGVADFVARPPTVLPPGAAANTALPTDAELDTAGPQRAMGYDRAWWFARFMADDYGLDALRRLYVEACGPRHGDFATAVRRAFDADMTELRARWARWLTR
ncbi:basic secretory family protein [Mycolicibacterium litorale]|uniref:Basic secretory family protein n=1 Tax=Candidatus Mycolicibacterium alkanivorans TaxID=2954114 RepID=A0ABS9YWA6_9MYCO|nr:basic secretory family protein [Candidatus Mycolicibacterium alkanivorans]MCI4675398.1 basic secretory family protein [Candidatus Mycolicibacterium alkanivorans]